MVKLGDCLATLDSGNFAFVLSAELEKEGISSKVVPTPCRISRSGCGYCIRISENVLPILIEKSRQKGFYIREVFRVIQNNNKISYERIT